MDSRPHLNERIPHLWGFSLVKIGSRRTAGGLNLVNAELESTNMQIQLNQTASIKQHVVYLANQNT